MKAVMDHFLVIKNQQDIDLEIKRIEMEGKAIEALQKKEGSIILLNKDKDDRNKLKAYKINHYPSNEVLTVAALGNDCAEMAPDVKVGSKVIVRAQTRPEETIYNGLVYFSFPIRSVSIVLEEEDINPPIKISKKK